ncbi:MAG: glycosyltransferase family 4 protein [Clostridia bacterium]|nr:glycosyltransferase family 4 protein [Clostridia bacterium]
MNIVFLVVCRFPYGDASSVRAVNICRLLKQTGHNIHVIGDYPSEENEKLDFCTYEIVLNNNNSFFKRQSAGKKSVAKLREYCKNSKVDAVLMNARYDRFNIVSDFCKKHNIKLLVENCEWYHNSSFKLGKFDLRFWRNQHMIKNDFKKADGFISISSFLDNHNKNFAMSVRIPTILDVKECEFSLSTNNKKLQIVYTGSPGKSKEFLKPVCEVLSNDPMLREKITFNIYGPSYKNVLINVGNEHILKECGNSVIVHGRVPQNEIQKILMEADYLLFLRPKRRSSDAGFPTKLGESFAVGTPVITNNTGDIGLYLKDGENGYLLKNMDYDSIRDVLYRALDYKKNSPNMRKNARITAENYFDFRIYENQINQLLSGVFNNDKA